jgi:RNA-dependent RNA polymerase
MNKFDSAYSRLDVLNIAKYIPCYLNRQVIVILTSCGVPDQAFVKLQDKMVSEMSKALTDRVVAERFLLQYYHSSFSSDMQQFGSTFDYTFEPFFRSLINTIYQKLMQELVKKSRIFVEKGRILMGCIDETGSLGPDEVFIQCTRQPSDALNAPELRTNDAHSDWFTVVNTDVIVAKNPCMHPGDLRVLRAVHRPQLEHMLDCVVFPACGPRPITNM